MSTRSIIHQATLNEWASRIKEQKSSVLSVSEWCLQNNLSKNMYFYWKRRLKEEVVKQALPDIVPLAIPAASPHSTSTLKSRHFIPRIMSGHIHP